MVTAALVDAPARTPGPPHHSAVKIYGTWLRRRHCGQAGHRGPGTGHDPAIDATGWDQELERVSASPCRACWTAGLAGDAANVVTIDIDADVTAQALTSAGYHEVRVVTGDGVAGGTIIEKTHSRLVLSYDENA